MARNLVPKIIPTKFNLWRVEKISSYIHSVRVQFDNLPLLRSRGSYCSLLDLRVMNTSLCGRETVRLYRSHGIRRSSGMKLHAPRVQFGYVEMINEDSDI